MKFFKKSGLKRKKGEVGIKSSKRQNKSMFISSQMAYLTWEIMRFELSESRST